MTGSLLCSAARHDPTSFVQATLDCPWRFQGPVSDKNRFFEGRISSPMPTLKIRALKRVDPLSIALRAAGRTDVSGVQDVV